MWTLHTPYRFEAEPRYGCRRVEIHEHLGLLSDGEAEFEVVGDAVQIRKAARRLQRTGQSLIARLRARGTVRMSTDRILALTKGTKERCARC